MKEIGLQAGNVSYSTDSVADYTAIFNMSGGKLSISGSQVQMKDVNISGGEVSGHDREVIERMHAAREHKRAPIASYKG